MQLTLASVAPTLTTELCGQNLKGLPLQPETVLLHPTGLHSPSPPKQSDSSEQTGRSDASHLGSQIAVRWFRRQHAPPLRSALVTHVQE